ncbi:CehA/McbA family metallohydrolase [Nonomuraea sp. NPDC050536]|uniref:CehA/McbA family metallohydrolase n=1 Tax=Nonomuraea sp. NPDC050536 TaxID=3364366 RepID=UPI0037CBD4C9
MTQDPMLPEAVAGALREYQDLLGRHGITWGEPESFYVKLFGPRRVLPVELSDRFWTVAFRTLARRHPGRALDELGTLLPEADYDEVLRDTLDGALPAHAAALRITGSGVELAGRARTVLQGRPPGERIPLLIDVRRDTPAEVEVDGTSRELRGNGAWLVEVEPGSRVTVDGTRVRLGSLQRTARPVRLRVRAGLPCRWSVTGQDGQGWFPAGVPHRHDFHGRPYFHGDDLELEVPDEPLTVTVTRGMEYGQATATVRPPATVELTPRRIYDAAARGWYGGDLHVHLNWAGDTVAAPAEAAAAQHGEDLHVLNLLAGNVSGARVYDLAALEHWMGRDLPWSDATHLARMGVEYRNDLLGHVSAFAPSRVPGRFHTGFDGEADWPPNADALRELRELGAVVGYSHPFHLAIGEQAPPAAVIGPVPRVCASRELVADAALGLVDGMDVLTHANIAACAAVYRRLVGAGNRLAVTAGTDTMISFTRADRQSSPPGWARVYAQVDGPLSTASYAEAIRAGRTFATTGPWLELSVDGHGPGQVIDARPGQRLTVTASAIGPEVRAVRVRTAEGVTAGAECLATGLGEALSVTVGLEVSEPTYVLAEALCEPHPRTQTATGYALTSPVHVDVGGRRVARQEDVRWCLEWLDLLQDLIERHGRLDSRDRLADHLNLLDQARAVYRARLE